MTDYWSGSITFTGLGSGTDFESIIEATMNVEGYRLTQMQRWEAQWKAKLEQVQNIFSEIKQLKSQLEQMDTVNEFLVKSATSSNTSVLSVTASADALEGTHSILVGQKAQNDIWSTTEGWASKSTVVTETDASFALTCGGKQLTIDVPAGTTLEGLVNLINNDTKMGDSVRANLVNDGNRVQLQVRGLDLGADNAVSIVDLGASAISGLAPDAFEHNQQARNAQIKVDGYPAGADSWIERSSNSFSDVIEGLSFTILGSGKGDTVDITVSTDTESVITNIESFLERINAIRDAIRALDSTVTSSDDEGTSTTGYELRGNYGMTLISRALQDMLTAKGLGFQYYDSATKSGDPYASLTSLGITTDADQDSLTFGHLVVDYDALEQALQADPNAVARIFAAKNDGVSRDATLTFDSAISGITKPGEYTVTYTVENGAIVSANIDGQEASIEGWTITGGSGNGAAGMAVTANNQADGMYSGTVCVRQGKIPQVIEALKTYTSSENGTLKIIEDSYQSIIDNNSAAMVKEEARLELKRKNLVARYAVLESLLGYYNDLSSSLEYQLSQLE